MVKDGRKAAIGIGVAGIVVGGILYATSREKKPPAPPPELANIYGVVTNADTGEPIAGADVIVAPPMIVSTDADGYYEVLGLETGTYHIRVEKEGYEMTSRDITLYEGDNKLNVQMTPIAPELANIYGVVTFRETGAPLYGVKVSMDGIITYTNASGEYLIKNQSPGNYLMTLEKEGYEPLSDTVTLVEGNNKIDAEMTLIPALMASLSGYVTDADTGAAIAGAEIIVVEHTGFMEANVYMGTTDASGYYSMANMAFDNSPIVVDITVKTGGYFMIKLKDVGLDEGANVLNFEVTPKEIDEIDEIDEIPVELISFDYPEQVAGGEEFWAGQTVFLPYVPGIAYKFFLIYESDDYEQILRLEETSYLAADIYDELEALGLLPEQKGRSKKYIRLTESGEYTHYGVGAVSYSEPALAGWYEEPFPVGIYPVTTYGRIYHVEIGPQFLYGYHLKKIADLWETVVGNIEILPPILTGMGE